MTDSTDLEYCGIGIRGVAMAIDAIVWFALFFVATYAVAIPTGELETTAEGVNADLTGSPAMAAFTLWVALALGYHAVLEWRYGQTIGKALVKIRVAAPDGSPASLRATVLRSLSRIVDWLPAFYVVGIVVALRSDRYARLGDRLGETVVVRA